MSKWIDVNDRLPEKDTDVLVCFDDGFMATVFFGEDFDLWVDSGEPIAWMPLPEPYKLLKKKKFSQDTLNFFKCIDKKYKWIAKDEDSIVHAFCEKPTKEDAHWFYESMFYISKVLNQDIFSQILWEDEEPVCIDDYVER